MDSEINTFTHNMMSHRQSRANSSHSQHSSTSKSSDNTRKSSSTRNALGKKASKNKPTNTPSSPNSLYRKFWSIIQPYVFNLPYATATLTLPPPSILTAHQKSSPSPTFNSPELLKYHIKIIVQIYESIYKNENRDVSGHMELLLTPKEKCAIADERIEEALRQWRLSYIKSVEKMLERRLERYDERFEKVSSMTPTLESIFAQIVDVIGKKYDKGSVMRLFVENMSVREKKIAEIDSRFVEEFDGIVERLNLTGNQISHVPSRMPSRMSILNLGANQLTDDSLREFASRGHDNLQHLGLSFNSLETCYFFGMSRPKAGDVEESSIKARFPNILSLDLSYNNICDVDKVIESLRSLPNLRLLQLNGNPMCLYKHYRELIISGLEELMVLDDQDVGEDERENSVATLREAEEARKNSLRLYEEAKAHSLEAEKTSADEPSDTAPSTNNMSIVQTHLPAPQMDPSTVFIQFLIRKLSGVELLGTPPGEEEPPGKSKKPPKKKPKKGAVVEEAPEYAKIVEYQITLKFLNDVPTEWIREKEIIDVNINEVVEALIGEKRLFEALRLPVPCRIYRRSKEVLVSDDPDDTHEPDDPNAPPRVKNETTDFVGESCLDLSSFLEYPRQQNIDVAAEVSDISKVEQPVVGRMTLRGEVNLCHERPATVVVEEEEPVDDKKKKGQGAAKGKNGKK
uniref:Uncharacterized protein n=1 Tax=Percolomonas cosmopolitus TaxID=63605 RepID=A0A7S1PEI5_9EUKA|mmetsp:Transcript_1233/g.4214  ORF Transcript_1233/g.4214 Transcript_1233/m.4214 type:complete len:686 (+) Transcript_1233:714-2771(+)